MKCIKEFGYAISIERDIPASNLSLDNTIILKSILHSYKAVIFGDDIGTHWSDSHTLSEPVCSKVLQEYTRRFEYVIASIETQSKHTLSLDTTHTPVTVLQTYINILFNTIAVRD